MTPTAAGQGHQESRPFSTMTPDLLALGEGRHAAGGTQVALGSPGSYGRPVDPVVAGQVPRLVGNAQPLQTVPGRKTAVKAAEGIAALVRHGLIRGRCSPAPAQRALRALPR